MLTRRQILAAPVLLTGCASASREHDDTLAIQDATIIDPVRGVLGVRSVVLRGERISQIAKSPPTDLPSDTPILEAAGRFLVPGFWDMHVHLSNTKESALPILLAHGVTSVRDIGGRLSEIDMWRGEIHAGRIQGPRIFRSGPMLNGRFADYQLLVSNAAEARGAVRALQRAGVDFIKLHRMTPRDAYFGIAEEARKLKIPFGGHIPRTVSPEEASDAGQWTIEHVETLFEGTFSDARDDIPLAGPIEQFKKDGAMALFERFARNRNWYTPTLTAFETANHSLFEESPNASDVYVSRSSWRMTEQIRKDPPPAWWFDDRKAQFPHHLDLVGMAQEAGVGLLTGTDMAATIVPGASLHREMELHVEAGLSTTQALRSATANPAAAFGRDDLGTIEPGRIADMVLLRSNPIDNISNVREIDAVIARGRLFNREAIDGLLAEGRESAKLR